MTAHPLTASLAWGHERVVLVNDDDSGLRAVIAIHSNVLGPALGGLRIWQYDDGLTDALDDALRLSRAMTLKASAAGLDLGGGKAVIVDDGDAARRPERLIRFAAELERLDGAYITAEDVGTTTRDMDLIARHTRHVVGRSERDGIGGDPSPDTARTVLAAMRAGLAIRDGSDDLEGRTIGVVGLGKVGAPLAEWLLEAGAKVVGYDLRRSSIDGVEYVHSVTELLSRELDVLSPCAMGGLIDDRVAMSLRCRVVCGAANNPLRDKATAALLDQRDILYVPDFLANCGGLVHAEAERRNAAPAEVERALVHAAERTRSILGEARDTGRLPAAVAEEHAWRRIEQAQ